MSITSFDRRMFHYAKEEALKSTFNRFHVGAVIAYKHKIIGSGHNSNKTHPMQEKYNELYRTFNNASGCPVKHSIHAEVSALTSIPYLIGKEVDFSKAKIYVYRVAVGKPKGYGNSFPCPACLNAIRDTGIKDIYYTSDFGLSYLRLD